VQRIDQRPVIRLRLVDQNVDADRSGAHRIEIGEGLGEGGAVERRALSSVSLRLRGEGHQQDAAVLFDGMAERRVHGARVVKSAFGIQSEGDPYVGDLQVPAEARQQDGEDDEDHRDDAPRDRHAGEVLENGGKGRSRRFRQRVGGAAPFEGLVHALSRGQSGAQTHGHDAGRASPFPAGLTELADSLSWPRLTSDIK